MRRIVSLLATAAVLLASLLPAGAAPVAAAQPYTLATAATYDVEPDARRVAVSIKATFTNLTPNPPGQFSVFSEVPIAVQDAATGVSARDDEGKLNVSTARQKGGDGQPVNVATVELRAPLKLKKSATFTLSYTLPDGKDGAVRIRPSVVTFPVWGFGTSSAVSVGVPAAYHVSSDGDTLTASRGADQITLTSGPIADPQHWLAVLTADRETALVTVSRSVPLDGGTVDLNVRSWADDAAWGTRNLDLLAKALPRLQKHIGLPYGGVGPLVVTESLPSGTASIAEAGGGAQELQVGYDQPPFTLLHQAAHVWIGTDLVADRWIREGLASHYAGLVAAELKIATPYDPVKQMAGEKAAAFPLQAWTADAADDRSAYGYPAAWAFVNRLATEAGEDALSAVLARVSKGTDAYDQEAVAASTTAALSAPRPLGSHGLLDQLQTVSGQDLSADFSASIFDDASDALVRQRAAARSAYDGLLAAAGDWGAPRPVLAAMAAWRFDEARQEIGDARSWLAGRDELLRAIEQAGLSSPERLRDPYESSGGGTDARVELQAERAVVDDYQAALDRANDGRSFVERIGLLGGSSPDELLATAHGRFADGDLRGAADATSQARLRLDGAQTSGLLRLSSAVLVILIALALIVYLLRRRRTLARNVD